MKKPPTQFQWCDTGGGWSAGETPAYGANLNGSIAFISLCQAVLSFLGDEFFQDYFQTKLL